MFNYAEILDGPDYFTCHRYHCRMSKKACVANQQAADSATPQGVFRQGLTGISRAETCIDCLQGIQIRAELGGDSGTCMMKGCNNPVKAKGLCPKHYLQAWRAEKTRRAA